MAQSCKVAMAKHAAATTRQIALLACRCRLPKFGMLPMFDVLRMGVPWLPSACSARLRIGDPLAEHRVHQPIEQRLACKPCVEHLCTPPAHFVSAPLAYGRRGMRQWTCHDLDACSRRAMVRGAEPTLRSISASAGSVHLAFCTLNERKSFVVCRGDGGHVYGDGRWVE